MADVLVTGGTGLLGRLVVTQLAADGHAVRVLSRHPPASAPAASAPTFTYATGDLRASATLLTALEGVDTVVHCASDPRHGYAVDVDGTGRLIEAMRETGCDHLVYVSIVGIDRIPLAYYRVKEQAEQVIQRSGIGWTIQRATQFHSLLDSLLGGICRLPVVPLPRGLRFQPVEPADLARHLARRVTVGPAGRVADFGGPEVLTVEELARSWLDARNRKRLIVPAPLPGKIGRALKAGANLCPEAPVAGTRTWRQYLHAPRST